MTTFQVTLQASNSCLIFGDRQGGKLLVSCLLLEQAGVTSVSIVSPFDKALTHKKLQETKLLATRHHNALQIQEPLCAHDHFDKLKAAYGFEFLLKDFCRIIEHSTSEAIIFHRIDNYFSIQDRRFIGDFFRELSRTAKEANKYIYLTLLQDLPAQHLFEGEVEKYLDLELVINRDNQHSSNRSIDVKYSSMPLQATHYKLTAEVGTVHRIVPHSDVAQLQLDKTSFKVLVVSQNPQTVNRIGYLLEENHFQVKVCQANVSDVVSSLMQYPDLVIYEPGQSLELNLYEIAKSNQLKVIELSQLTHLRKSDRLLALQQGCFDILEQHYFVEDLVIAIEKALNFTFYETKAVQAQTADQSTKENLEARIDAHLKARRCFCVLEFSLKACSDKSLNTAANYLPKRDTDAVFYDKENERFFLFVSNILNHNAAIVESKVTETITGATLTSVREATEFALVS